MVIEQINEKKLLIVLEEKDMSELGLKYENISWSNQKSRNIIAKLLALAKAETGFSIENYKLSIEALPQFNGCIIIFTLANKEIKNKSGLSLENGLYGKKQGVIIYKFDSLDDILNLCKRIYGFCEKENYKSDIYAYKGDYYLVIYSYEKLKEAVYIMLSEYGHMLKQGKIFVSYLNECGYAVKKNNAVISIGKNLQFA